MTVAPKASFGRFFSGPLAMVVALTVTTSAIAGGSVDARYADGTISINYSNSLVYVSGIADGSFIDADARALTALAENMAIAERIIRPGWRIRWNNDTTLLQSDRLLWWSLALYNRTGEAIPPPEPGPQELRQDVVAVPTEATGGEDDCNSDEFYWIDATARLVSVAAVGQGADYGEASFYADSQLSDSKALVEGAARNCPPGFQVVWTTEIFSDNSVQTFGDVTVYSVDRSQGGMLTPLEY